MPHLLPLDVESHGTEVAGVDDYLVLVGAVPGRRLQRGERLRDVVASNSR